MKRTNKPVPIRKPGKPGPKSKCTQAVIQQAYDFCLLGLTDWQMATHFGVSQDTFSHWLKTIPEFKEAVEQGRQYADADMAKMLYKVGMGQVEQEAVKFFKTRVTEKDYDDQGNVIHEKSYDKIITVPYTKKYQPDTKAIIKWLGVRNRETWGESIKVEHDHRHAHIVGGEIDMNIVQEQISDPKQFSEEELRLVTEMGLQQLAEEFQKEQA